MNIFLPDGSAVEVSSNATIYDCANAVSRGLAKKAMAGTVNGTPRDLYSRVSEGDTVTILTFDSPEGKEIFWHSSAHILAEAVQQLYPEAKLAIGPAIESGFYYDFDVATPFTPEDLAKIEKECLRIVGEKKEVKRISMTRNELEAYYDRTGEVYKKEMLADIPGEPSVYAQGDWFDMCRGPHLPNTGMVKAIKLLSSSGAYWKGDETRPMLQRIYGISFPKKKLLTEHLELLEEAKKRDHKKLGRQLGLFSFHKEGTGFPFWHDKGMVLYNEIAQFSREEHIKRGYGEIKTPIVLHEELWHRSGHWDKYRDDMYFVDMDEKPHAIKPMNCPGGLLVFKDSQYSFRDLPVRNFELGLVHRHEKSSVLNGLFRVRQFTQDDAHIFCRPDQIEQEINDVIDFIFSVYKTFGFEEFFIELSTRPEQYIGEIEIWDKAEEALRSVLETNRIDYQLNPGDGAFYGPKIDFHIRDSLRRSWQCGTIQLDFSMPERFCLEYTDSDGSKQQPVMIHRAIFGSMERFIGILIENYAGFLPLWLSPEQVRVISVSDKFAEYGKGVTATLKKAGIRASFDRRNEKIGYKIRDAEVHKVPYMVIVGEKEETDNTLSVRLHKKGDLGTVTIKQFIDTLLNDISSKAGY
ncbi:threonine--tRNA ligase [Chitinivibrio alkaliphilus]|uniref:Threonine--tRNA ligase n=1 Tax=Chitinivibrio alkaliphilus ACht1 TaxID=1313304 RepID=U7D7I6_9BACT|nr:threonine--tRNA ligase [Chitinivibrio alkaliphilus]ERP31893.1 threonyl-tRNA synthetase [Chitinivibrio alkaliphilus ACht1]